MDIPSSSKDANRSKFRSNQHKKNVHKKPQKSTKQQQEPKKPPSRKKSTGDDEPSKFSQPTCRFADIDTDSDEKSYDGAKSFKELLDAPTSMTYFMFKDEKNWEWTESPFSEHFSIDVDNLAKIFNSIPFNEYMSIENKYLTKDDITSINSSAELSRREYLEELKAKEELEKSLKNDSPSTNKDSTTGDEIEEDLDFLLSLKEPVRTLPTKILTCDLKTSEDLKQKPTAPPTKSVDLEKWLDSVLDD